MEKNVLQQRCLLHQLETIAFDLDPLAQTNDKYLCLKCLMNSSPYRQSETIQDALQKFREMTTFEYNNKKNQIKLLLEQLLNVQKQIKEFQELFNNKISDSIKILNSKIQEEQNELNSLIDPQQELQTEQDLINLSNYVNYGFINNNNYETNPKQLEFINQIQQLLDYQIFDELLQNISNQLESTYTKSLIEEQIKLILPEQQQVDQNKFISLRYLCQTHQSNITMISLEPGQIKQRMFCQICIQEKKLDGLNSLFELNKKWQNYLQNIYLSHNKLHNNRSNNLSKITELIVQYQKFDQDFFKGLNKQMINQNIKIIKEKNQLQVLNLNKQLYQMELKEIKQIAETLLQQNQMQEVLQKQNQIQNEDKQNYDQICDQFNQLQKKLFETQLEIPKFFCMNDQIVGQIKLNEKKQLNLSIKNLHINQIYRMKRSQNNLSINNINVFTIQLNKSNLQPTKFKHLIQVQEPHIQEQRDNIIIYDPQFQKIDFKFSDKLKYSLINFSDNKKIATTTQSNLFVVCLCDKPIPQNGSFVVDFKINKLSQIMIGICKRKSIKKDFIFDNYSSFGHGFYVLHNQGFIFSHHDSQKNHKKLGFQFEQDDLIIVEVNQQTKQIIWKNRLKGLNYALEILPSEDLYFCCVLLFGQNRIAEVEII